MSNADLYQNLSKKIGTENSTLIPQIWRTICSEEEADILSAMPGTAEELAEKFGKGIEEMNSIIHELFIKGVVFEVIKEGVTRYRMPNHIIQFHDATILWKDAPQKMIDLWVKYMNEEFSQIPEMLTAINFPPFFRVIPINEGIESQTQILPYEDAAKIVEEARNIAVTDCTCRLIMKKCDKPLNVCIQLNKGADYAIKRGTGRKIDVEEAKQILKTCEEAGLVHTTENKAGVGTVICNCCECCCEVLPFLKNPATKGVVAPSRYRASVDGELCTSCGSCIDICPMGAISMNEVDIASVDSELCIGCGLCTNDCPVDAIVLVEVREESFIPS
ncbi:MAG: 4Fe-4S binding protein [Thermodesulfobacteriota bacterium]|nr:4Fe-4S binding protein [Thermodesulfobacteriota bacterium]